MRRSVTCSRGKEAREARVQETGRKNVGVKAACVEKRAGGDRFLQERQRGEGRGARFDGGGAEKEKSGIRFAHQPKTQGRDGG